MEPTSGDVIWSDKMDLERKAKSRSAPSVVEALSQALDEAVDQAAAGMKVAVELARVLMKVGLHSIFSRSHQPMSPRLALEKKVFS